MSITTRLTERLGLVHPIINAPMAFAAGWKLASAVSKAGGLGVVGGGYGDEAWLSEQLGHLDNQRFGCGFITWSLHKQPHLLDLVLERKPNAVLLSFGDPKPFAERIKAANALLICQVQTRKDAERAIESGADIVVAQGAEAGGHGDRRATMTLVPEVADLIAAKAPDTLLCAAGGIADGRAIAAALMLGADGVLIGSRLWASNEANVSTRMHDAALAATGDDTVRTSVMDVARKLEWPNRYTARVLKNEFTARWHGNEEALKAVADEEAIKYRQAWSEGDPERSNTFVGEVAGLLHRIEPVEEIIARLMRETESRLAAYS